MKKNIIKFVGAIILIGSAWSCQQLDRPELGDYPKDDIVLPNGDLRFYIPFDKESHSLRVQFSEELSGYPAFLPDQSIESQQGIKNKAYKGSAKAALEYMSSNDFVEKAQSFTISYWMKHAPKTTNAEFVFSIASSNGHWSKSAMCLMNESTKDGIAIKMITVDKNKKDNWFVWEKANAVPASVFFDDQWHHCALVYDAASSLLTFYVDGVQVGTPKAWKNHGAIDMDPSKAEKFILGGPAGNSSWMKPWNGGIDQFRLYAAALSASEVAQLFNNKE